MLYKQPYDHNWQKDISGCGLFGAIHKKRQLIPGTTVINGIACQHDRGNGQGGGFAAYGIYPEMAEYYAIHLMCQSQAGMDNAEEYIKQHFTIRAAEPIPTRKVLGVTNIPLLWRYFVTPKYDSECELIDERDYVVRCVMHINTEIADAFVTSSGKNMGAFKGVGYPEDIANFFKLDEYSAYIWTAHNRFPTNTQAWWGGAHPFTILDWSIVHNGEISSYGINKRYLDAHDYKCTLYTDTEVVAYLLDLLIRKHGLSKRMACHVFAPPFWSDIDAMPEEQRKAFSALRMIYGSGLLNGPFAILFADSNSLTGLNDRIKLRPLIIAESGDITFMSSEESSIRVVCPNLDRVWAPKAGEPVTVELED